MKKLLSTLLLALLCIATASAWDFSAPNADGVTIYYEFGGENYVLVCESTGGYSGHVNIPEIVTYDDVAYTVLGIQVQAFSKCRDLISVSMPNTVQFISAYAFEECESLTEINLSNDLRSIDDNAFYNCNSLSSINIPNTVSYIGSEAFCLCESLTSVSIPESVKYIGFGTFSFCGSLRSVSIPNSVINIGKKAFWNCSSLSDVTIPDSVEIICESAFQDCSNLTTVNLSNSLIEIEKHAFSDCSSLKSISIPNSVEEIGNEAFNDCSNLAEITIGESVQKIGSSAFAGCGNLKRVYNYSVLYLVKGSTDYGYVACFADEVINYRFGSITLDKYKIELVEGQTEIITTNLPEEVTDKTVVWTSSDDSVATVDQNGVVTAIAPGNATITATWNGVSVSCEVIVNKRIIAVESIELDQIEVEMVEGESVTLTATVLPEDATDNTFWTSSAQWVATVDQNGVVTAIAPGNTTITASCGKFMATCEVTVYERVIAIESVTIDQTEVEMIEGESLMLIATVLPEDATDKIVVWTSSDENVATVNQIGGVTAVAPGNTTIIASCGEVMATCEVTVYKRTIAVELVTLDQTEVEMVVGESITLMATVLPEDADDKTVVWTSSDDSVATVDENGIVIAIDYGIATITASCGGCSANCEVIVRNAFDFALENGDGVVIYYNINADGTVSVTNGGWSGGSYSGGLSIPSSVSYGGGSYSVSSIGNGAFSGCDGITSVNIPNSVNSIEEDAFANCTGLEKLTIPASVTSIDKGAFENCSNLTEVTIGKSVTSIGENAYYGCENLKTVFNLSDLDIVKGETTNGYVAYYADAVLNGLPVSSITLNLTNVQLVVGETVTLAATVMPEDAYDKTVVWISSDENVATVDENGIVTAIAPGDVIITAACGGIEATCEVIVSDKETGLTSIFATEDAEIFDLNGRRVSNPEPGMYIVRTANGVKKIIVR